MKIKVSDIENILSDLHYSLNHVTHPGLLLVWIWEYFSILYCVSISESEASVSRHNCTESLPWVYTEFLDALAEFRNAFVHRGPTAATVKLRRLRCVNVTIVRDLFELTKLPEIAQHTYWKWFEGGASVENI